MGVDAERLVDLLDRVVHLQLPVEHRPEMRDRFDIPWLAGEDARIDRAALVEPALVEHAVRHLQKRGDRRVLRHCGRLECLELDPTLDRRHACLTGDPPPGLERATGNHTSAHRDEKQEPTSSRDPEGATELGRPPSMRREHVGTWAASRLALALTEARELPARLPLVLGPP